MVKEKKYAVKELLSLITMQYYKIPVALSLALLLVAASLAALGNYYWANQMALYSFYLLVAGFFVLIYMYIKQTRDIKRRAANLLNR